MKRTFWKVVWGTVFLLAATLQQLPAQAQGFSTPVKVSTGTISLGNPQVAVDPTGTNILWTENGRTRVLFRRTLDGGSSFTNSPVLALPWISGPIIAHPVACIYEPCVRLEDFQVDGQGNIHVVASFYAISSLAVGTVYSRSTDHGATFSAPVILVEDSLYDPQILVDGAGAINMVWTSRDDEILFRRSTDGGQSFSPPMNLSQSEIWSYSQRSVLDSVGNVSIVWIEEAQNVTRNVYFGRVENGANGPVASSPVALSSGIPYDSYDARVAVDQQGYIYVVWAQAPCAGCIITSSSNAISFTRSTDGGLTFSEPIAVAVGRETMHNPYLVVGSQGQISIAWEEANKMLRFSRSSDGGATFTAPMQVAQTPVTGCWLYPQLLSDPAGNLNLLWSGYGAGAGWDVQFARSTDGGASFSLPQVLSSSTSPVCPDPKMAADQQGNVSVVWLQADPSLPGSVGVFLARLSLGSTPTGEDITVQPVDPVSGTSPVTITFDDVAQSGQTTVTTSSTGQPPPTGLKLGNPPTYYEISTTAFYSGSIVVCISYANVSFGNEENLKLFHNDGANWNDITISLDTDSNIICGEVPSLSPFAIFEPANHTPTANAGPDQAATCATVAGTKITLDGTASTDPDSDNLTYTWTGPFTEGDGTVTGATFAVTLPMGTHTITLTVDDGNGGLSTDTVRVTVGIGVMGVPPPLNELVSDGWFVPLANRAFRAGSTLPLRMKLYCGSEFLTSQTVTPPRITALIRNGDEINLAILDLDAGQANDEGVAFRFADGLWVFNLTTKGWRTGTYVVAIEVPDGRVFQAAFVLK